MAEFARQLTHGLEKQFRLLRGGAGTEPARRGDQRDGGADAPGVEDRRGGRDDVFHDVLDEVLPGKAGLWVEIMERLGLVDQLVAPGSNVPHVELTQRARQVMLELLLEPTTWNGPLLTQNITVSLLWQLSQTHNCLE